MMPEDNWGNGPAEIGEAAFIKFEVWDQVCDTYGSFDFLPDAIDHAEKLNVEYEAQNADH